MPLSELDLTIEEADVRLVPHAILEPRDLLFYLVTQMSWSWHCVLPAIHILTGCDTTSKVGTKLSALNLENHCLAQIKMKLYTKLSIILYKY